MRHRLRTLKHYQRGQHSLGGRRQGLVRAAGPGGAPLGPCGAPPGPGGVRPGPCAAPLLPCASEPAGNWKAAPMDLHEAIRRRAMVRSFAADPVDPVVVETVIQAALRAPSAGNTAGTSWVVLEGADQTSPYWESTTDRAWRTTSARWPGLRRAPVILLAYASAEAYVARYAEPDKAGPLAGAGPGPGPGAGPGNLTGPGDLTGPALGLDAAEWPVPYWMGDAAFGVMTVLLCRGGCRSRCLRTGQLPGRESPGERPGRARALAPVLCRPAGPSRRQGPPFPVAGPPQAGPRRAHPPGRLVRGSTRGTVLVGGRRSGPRRCL